MISLTSYAAQTILLAVLLLVFTGRKQKMDAFIGIVVAFWVVAVIYIYSRYGAEQITFYSNDQAFHWDLLNQYIPREGIPIRLEEMLGWRYPVILPVYFISKLGFDGILLLKFSQLVYLILIYRLGRRFISRNGIIPRWWHVTLFCGPIFIFMSTLALRDIAIAFFAASFMLESNHPMRIVGLVGTLLLRPHLAVAMIVGLIIGYLLKNIKPKYLIPAISLGTLITYTFGSIMYFVGATFKDKIPLRLATDLFNQEKFVRFSANLFGLQFLTLLNTEFEAVDASVSSLLLARVVFFDTFLTPLLFLIVLFSFSPKWGQLRLSVFFTFTFFYGLISQTDWNSSRQNMPFFVMMGLVAIVGIEARKASREELVA
jgi:hypothetical protein